MDASAEIGDDGTLWRWDSWSRLDGHADDQHLLVERVVVVKAGDECRWCDTGDAEQVRAGPMGAHHSFR